MPYTKLKVSSFLIVMQWLFIITVIPQINISCTKSLFFSLWNLKLDIISFQNFFWVQGIVYINWRHMTNSFAAVIAPFFFFLNGFRLIRQVSKSLTWLKMLNILFISSLKAHWTKKLKRKWLKFFFWLEKW